MYTYSFFSTQAPKTETKLKTKIQEHKQSHSSKLGLRQRRNTVTYTMVEKNKEFKNIFRISLQNHAI